MKKLPEDKHVHILDTENVNCCTKMFFDTDGIQDCKNINCVFFRSTLKKEFVPLASTISALREITALVLSYDNGW